MAEKTHLADVTEFEEIVKAHQARVYNVCLRLVGNPEDAFDLSQETFIKAWRNIENFRGDSAVFTWLYRLAVNACTDFLRKKSRRDKIVYLPLDDSELILPDTKYEPSAVLEKREIARSLETALGNISSDFRKIIALRETAGLSYAEIAEVLEINEGTVKSRLARARLALREELIKLGNDYRAAASKEYKGGEVR